MLHSRPAFSFISAAQRATIARLAVPLRSRAAMSRGYASMKELLEEQPGEDPDDVEFRTLYGSRTITLNRPKKLNSLNQSMARKIYLRLKEWEKSDLANVVVIKGVGRAFCAGGDVNVLASNNQEGPAGVEKSTDYFKLEYNLDYLISTYKKPYVAVMDGITMGGGVGLSIHAPFRIATENTIFAMPETTIGFFPDVGASFFLPRMDGNVGTYLALTSAQLRGVDVFYHGLATHFIHSSSIAALESRLSDLTFPDTMPLQQRITIINSTIEEFATGLPTKAPTISGALRTAIDNCFNPNNSIGQILTSLVTIKESKDVTIKIREWAEATEATIRERSPTSVAVTLRQMKEARKWSIREAFVREHGIASAFMQHPDFVEGVTARLVERRKERPNWQPANIEDVPKDDIQTIFETAPGSLELPSRGKDGDFVVSPYQHLALPTEADIVEYVQANGASLATAVEFFSQQRMNKLGVSQKVTEVYKRNAGALSAKA